MHIKPVMTARYFVDVGAVVLVVPPTFPIVPGVIFSVGIVVTVTVKALLSVTVSGPLAVGVVTVMLYVPAAEAGFIVSGTERLLVLEA